MTSSTKTNITVTAITSAINDMVNASLSFAATCDKVRAARAKGSMSTADVRACVISALVSKVPAYRAQTTESGAPAQDSALKKAVSRLMAATDPAKAETAAHSVPVKVSKALIAAVMEEDARHAEVMKALREKFGSAAVSAARKAK